MTISVVCSCNSQSKSYCDRKKCGARGDYLVLCCSSALVLIVQQLSNKRSNSFENSNLTTSLKLSMDKLEKKNHAFKFNYCLKCHNTNDITTHFVWTIPYYWGVGGGATFYHTMSIQAYNALNCSHPSSELNTVHFGLRSALVAV